jgi:hypothetical protein
MSVMADMHTIEMREQGIALAVIEHRLEAMENRLGTFETIVTQHMNEMRHAQESLLPRLMEQLAIQQQDGEMLPIKTAVVSTARMAQSDHSILDNVVGTKIPGIEEAAASTDAYLNTLDLKHKGFRDLTNEKMTILDHRMTQGFGSVSEALTILRATKPELLEIQYCHEKIEFLTKRMNEMTALFISEPSV